jgi:glycosyltransferase involved in cell wall biosynthesis
MGGVEINTHELARELIAAGHQVSVVSKLSPRDLFGAKSLMRSVLGRQAVQRDDSLGYPVYRSLEPWNQVGALPKVDAAVIQNGKMIEFGRAFRALGSATVAYLHGLPFERWHADGVALEELPFDGYLAVSNYVAKLFANRYALEANVVPPIFRRESYAVDVTGSEVTFINPVAEKGVELAIKVAELCPEVPFGFVLGWPLRARQLLRLKYRLHGLPNVRLHERERDMRIVYRRSRLLLVPSQWEAETWGRVASEAQFSGIPVIASDRGGLPEAVGAGGMILPHDDAGPRWASAVRRLWHDPELHRDLSSAAAQHARRSLLDPKAQAQQLVDTLASAGTPRERNAARVAC